MACTSTGVVPMDAGTFMIGKRSAEDGFGPPLKIEADVYREAVDFCSRMVKTVETTTIDVVDGAFARPGSVNLHFRCIDPMRPVS